jgi:hypothetical protein
MQYVQQRGSTCVKEAAHVSAHLQHNKCALVRPLIGHKSALVLSISVLLYAMVIAYKCALADNTSAHLFYTSTHPLPQPARRCALLTSGRWLRYKRGLLYPAGPARGSLVIL